MPDNQQKPEPCFLYPKCPYLSGWCRTTPPTDTGCYVYRRFWEIFKEQGVLKEGQPQKIRLYNKRSRNFYE